MKDIRKITKWSIKEIATMSKHFRKEMWNLLVRIQNKSKRENLIHNKICPLMKLKGIIT